MTTADDVRRAHGFHPLRVHAVVDETIDTRSFAFDIPDELRDDFRYRAGQFCTVRVRIDEAEHLRSYSMSSAPDIDDRITVTVKRVDGGVVSNWFNDHVVAGDVIEATKPMGGFCLRDATRPIVAYCGGSGVTPVLSIAKHALASTERAVRVLYANRDADAVIFAADLERLAAQHSRLTVEHHLDVEHGFVDGEDVARFAAADLDADFYICGPGPFMDIVEGALLGAGVDRDRVFIERFTPASGDGSRGGRADDGPANVPEVVTIVLNGKPATIPYRAGDTILETARRGGLQPPFSCEAGNCATCMAVLRDGTASMRVNDALTDDEVAEGWVLTCQAIPSGADVVVEYDPM